MVTASLHKTNLQLNLLHWDNWFFAGDDVMRICSLLVFASLSIASSKSLRLKDITIPESIAQTFDTFEPSAAAYLSDLNLFLVASDDTDDKDRPFLFLMDFSGRLDPKPILARGLDKMTDIESMFLADDGTLYLLSSQSLNKKGKEKPERNIMARATRRSRVITVTDSIDLRTILVKALQESTEPVLSEMAGLYFDELDIEASFVSEGKLFVGLKNPQPQSGKAVILDLGRVDSLFSDKSINPRLFRTIDFAKLSKRPSLLSDMVRVEDHLFITTTLEDSSEGHVWKYEIRTGQLTLLESVQSAKPEAFAPYVLGKSAILLFDNGEETAQFATMTID